MIKIIVVEDHLLVQRAVSRLLDSQKDFEVVGVAGDGCDAVRLVKSTGADVVLMDVALPMLGGVEATRRIIAARPDIRIIMVSQFVDNETVAAAISAGAMGYVSKAGPWEEMVLAIRSVHEGKPYISSILGASKASGFRKGRASQPIDSDSGMLSPREVAVLHLFANGHSIRSIGEALSVSPRTAESHVARIKRKLGITTLAGLVKYAIKHNIASV